MSTNSGGSYAAAPAPASSGQVVGATGTQRFRHLFTIPAGLGGTFTVTVSGDIFANPPNVPARLFYDGVDQGIVQSPGGDNHGPKTFTLPVVPGAHDLQLWIGQATTAGLTIPVVSFGFDGVTLDTGNGEAPGCCCRVLETVRCYRVITGAAFHHAYLTECGGTYTWRDVESGETVAPEDIENCSCGSPLVLPDLHMAGAAFNDAPGEFMCNVSPNPSATTGWAVTGTCYDPTVGAPAMDWVNTSSVHLEYGSPNNSGGVNISFSSTVLGSVTWPTNLTQMNPGEQRISQPLLGNRRAVLTYVSGPLGSAPSGSIRMTGGATINVHQGATNVAPPIVMRLDFYSPPCV